VGEARIVLKRHTTTQAIVGALLGIIVTAIQLLSFKLACLSYILTGLILPGGHSVEFIRCLHTALYFSQISASTVNK
jgi:hypothetical protein